MNNEPKAQGEEKLKLMILFLCLSMLAPLSGFGQLPLPTDAEGQRRLAEAMEELQELERVKSKVTVEVNYLGGDLKTQFDYPKADFPFVSGKHYDTNGIQVRATVAVTDRLNLGGRVERSFLGRPRYFDEDRFRKSANPDPNLRQANNAYQELFASVRIAKTGHRLIAGAARTKLNEESEFTVCPCGPLPSVPVVGDMLEREVIIPQFRINSRTSTTAIGPMVGVEGGHSVKRLGLGWSGRFYPRMSRTELTNSVSEFGGSQGDSKFSSTSHGFELGGNVSYRVADHVAIQGGYRHRQFYRPDQYPSDDWMVNETMVEKGFLGGLKFTF